MRLEAGKRYRRKDGLIVEILADDYGESENMARCNQGLFYHLDGQLCGFPDDPYAIIEEAQGFDFNVIWGIQITADTPREAAEIARQYQLDPDTRANVFTVSDDQGNITHIDLEEKE